MIETNISLHHLKYPNKLPINSAQFRFKQTNHRKIHKETTNEALKSYTNATYLIG